MQLCFINSTSEGIGYINQVNSNVLYVFVYSCIQKYCLLVHALDQFILRQLNIIYYFMFVLYSVSDDNLFFYFSSFRCCFTVVLRKMCVQVYFPFCQCYQVRRNPNTDWKMAYSLLNNYMHEQMQAIGNIKKCIRW